ncbi:MAG: hypothetical protein M1269_12310 [Chloroflexi bacterium]|nr:hypothetical protein [Chloroflexota bacterium]
MRKFSAPRRVILILLAAAVLFSCMAAVSAADGDEQWGWFTALAGENQWDLRHGKAVVSMDNGKLDALLYSSADQDAVLVAEIKGEIAGDRIKATMTRMDAGDHIRKFVGTYSKNELREAIQLSELDNPMGMVVGIVRECQ